MGRRIGRRQRWSGGGWRAEVGFQRRDVLPDIVKVRGVAASDGFQSLSPPQAETACTVARRVGGSPRGAHRRRSGGLSLQSRGSPQCRMCP